MLEQTETEETTGFFVIIFVIGDISIGEGPGPPNLVYAYALGLHLRSGRQGEERDNQIGKTGAVTRAFHYLVVIDRELSKTTKKVQIQDLNCMGGRVPHRELTSPHEFSVLDDQTKQINLTKSGRI